MGSFSVSKGPKNIIETLKYAGNILDDPKNLLLIFPQGKLFSNFADSIGFEKGLSKIAAFSQQKFQSVFAASFTEYFSQPKPTTFIYLKNEETQTLPVLPMLFLHTKSTISKSKKVQSAIVK